MKVAVIITGAMRSFDRCLPNLQWNVFRHFPDAKFYVATHDDEDAHKAELLGPRLARFEKFTQPEMVVPEGCPAEWTPGKPYMHEPYAISVPPAHVLGQLWINQNGWDTYAAAKEPADLIIRCRPDLWFHRFEVPPMGKFGLPYDEARTPRWGKFGGCNDRFALLGPKAAEAYFTAYTAVPAMIEAGAPLHPETLVYEAMLRAGVTVYRNMVADFSTLRKTGEMRPPEITGSDLLDAALTTQK